MNDPLNIFIPIDFKARSVNATRLSVDLAKLLNAKLFLCHVYNRPFFILDPDLGYDEDTLIRIENYSMRRMEEQVDEQFEELKRAITELSGVSHVFIKEVGSVVSSIIRSTERLNIDLIVMGTSGLSGLVEIWGNKTSDVVEHVSCPVLVIHEEVEKLNLEKIAIACDFCKLEDLSCLNILKIITRAAHSDIDIVHIAKKPKEINKIRELHVREAIKLHWHIKNHKKQVQYHCNPNVERGLIQYVNQNDVGLLALMHREHGFIKNLVSESLTHKMTFHAKVPLLALH